MAYDPDPAATHDPTSNVVVPVNWLDLINTNFAAIGAAWTVFTPTWTGSGSNPAIGNGSITGAYIKLGKTLRFRVRIVMGSTTTYGTGDWRITLPGSSTSTSTAQACGVVHGLDAATMNYVGCVVAGASSTYVSFNNDGNINNWGTTSPFTWGNGDALTFSAELEIA